MILTKQKLIRLTGKSLAKLNEDIHERDGYTCIIPGCGRHVALEEKFHHEPCGTGSKEDRIEKGLLLCYGVHHKQRHDGPNSAVIQRFCEDYLRRMYPEVWDGE